MTTTIVAQHVRRTSLAQRHPAILMGSLGALAVLLSFYSLSVGATEVSLGDVFSAVVGDTSNQAAQIVVDFQLPRVLLAWLVGIALAVSGAVMQGVIRNPLAAPDVVGVTKGAGFAGMLLLLAIPGLPVFAVVPAAFAGGLADAGPDRLGRHRGQCGVRGGHPVPAGPQPARRQRRADLADRQLVRPVDALGAGDPAVGAGPGAADRDLGPQARRTRTR
jgi:hypothetical protein